jgi:hypothetical protein
LVLTKKRSTTKEMMTHLGIDSKKEISPITNKEYVRWLGEKKISEIPYIRYNQPGKKIKIPKVYWIPATHQEVIRRLQHHGVLMDILKEPKEIEVTMFRISNQSFNKRPEEGHLIVSGKANLERRKEIFYPGSARIETNQSLRLLISFLLEPESPDSFFRWGFFLEIFDRTEYAEQYVMEPLAKQMLAKDEKLRLEFDNKKKADTVFANNPDDIYSWFYRRTPYFDNRYLLYPIGVEY